MDVAVRLGDYHWVIRKKVKYLKNWSPYLNKTFIVHFYESYSIKGMVNFDISNVPRSKLSKFRIWPYSEIVVILRPKSGNLSKNGYV